MTDITKLDFQDFWGENEDLFENGLTVTEEIVAEKLYNRVIACVEKQIQDLEKENKRLRERIEFSDFME